MKKMIFVCVAFVVMAGIVRVYMAGGISGLLDMMPAGGGMQSIIPEDINSVTTDKDVEVYKWRDEHGVMHFGSTPPQYAGTVEKINLKANQNIMDAVNVAKEVEQDAEDTIKQVSVDNPYSPQGMSDLLNQTQDFADSLSKQQADHKKQLDNIVR